MKQVRKPISFKEREEIERMLEKKKSYRSIGLQLGRGHTVIKREVERNTGDYLPYEAQKAQKRAEKRRYGKRKRKLQQNEELREYVVEKLCDEWSPEQIAGRLEEQEEKPPGNVSHESIYQYIYSEEGRKEKLYRHLRTYRSLRRKRGRRKSRKQRIPERISIHERPEIVETKGRYGDWEGDTVESARTGQGGISVHYERKSQLCRIHQLENKEAKKTEESWMKTIDSLPLHLFLTFTFDNGTENVNHISLRKEFDIETYFCDPYSSWQKGGVENCNKLIRQYFPKKTDFSKVSEEKIYAVQEKLNDRPRKSLRYRTPNEVISDLL